MVEYIGAAKHYPLTTIPNKNVYHDMPTLEVSLLSNVDESLFVQTSKFGRTLTLTLMLMLTFGRTLTLTKLPR